MHIQDYNKHLYGITRLTLDAYFIIAIPVAIFMVLGLPSFYFVSFTNRPFFFLRAEFTKDIVKPALGESGVGGAMAVYGAFDAIVSMRMHFSPLLFFGVFKLQLESV